jgi:hypothetical protein
MNDWLRDLPSQPLRLTKQAHHHHLWMMGFSIVLGSEASARVCRLSVATYSKTTSVTHLE